VFNRCRFQPSDSWEASQDRASSAPGLAGAGTGRLVHLLVKESRAMSNVKQLFFPRKTAAAPTIHRHSHPPLLQTCQPMLLSSWIRMTVLSLLLAVAFCARVFAQPNFGTNGGEYAIAGNLAADQGYPRLSIGPSGGYLVWHDNAIDGYGFGIGAIALDANLTRVSTPFRVNQLRGGDQERPQVALLKGGGAVFVWQGGQQGFQRIYARFLSPSNTWTTADLHVSTFGKFYQIHPAVTVLTNGNVVVVWAAFNRHSTNSMQDVYAQVLSPAGQKLGGEFLVNQFTSFNQRTPAVAALSTGGFAVSWVTEHQRSGPISVPDPMYDHTPTNFPSIEIFARRFESSGVPAAPEFAVNLGSEACANPTIAAAADGSFMIAWGQKNVSDRPRSWDVFARSFSSSSVGGVVLPLNFHLYGDQFAPQISAVGSTYLVIWTSMGQDGSWEGVYGRYLENSAFSGGEFRVNRTTINRQMHPGVAADSSGRFLVAWSGLVGGVQGFDLFAQRYVSANYVPIATPPFSYGPPPAELEPDPVTPIPPDGSAEPSRPILPFPVAAPSSSPATNGLASAAGTYHGLLYETNGVTAARAGYVTAKVTTRGTFTGKLVLAGRTHSLSGTFDTGGHASIDVLRPGMTTLSVDLYVDVSGGTQLRGQVAAGSWSADLLADRMVFAKTQPRTPNAGTYTFIISGDPDNNQSPTGNGFGSLKVDPGGTILFSGTLADGTKVTQSSAVSKQGVWPFYASTCTGRGVVLGWIQFVNPTNVGGNVVWIKPAGVSKYYPAGFTNNVLAIGSAYRAPTGGARAINITQGMLVLSGGGLPSAVSQRLTLGVNNRVTPAAGAKLALTITPATGFFKGTAADPHTGKSVPFQGALFQKDRIGVGYFLGTDASGEVYLSPAP
jgi:hypothetical protein